MLDLSYDDIDEFSIVNPEIPPENLGDKFCRLDINMIVNGQRVDIEIQVKNEGDYPERSLYYWARDFSSAISKGGKYIELPRTIIINILDFNLFDCCEHHSEFQALEVTRHTQLTDKMSLHYYELPKLPKLLDADNIKELWLKLFQADTEEELNEIEKLEVPVMSEAVTAYRRVVSSSELREIERLRFEASLNEASALHHAERKRDEHWQGVVDSIVAEKDAEKDNALAEKDSEIAELKARLDKLNSVNE